MKSRIISLLPAATEIVHLLGLEDTLVGISHDSDYPPSVNNLPKITTTVIDPALSSNEIDRQVKRLKHTGQRVFHIDQKLLAKLAPTLILTQELCSVCASSFTSVEKAAKIIDSDATLISLEPHTIEDIFQNIKTVAKFTNSQKQAEKVIKDLQKRLDHIKKLINKQSQPSVIIIEWLDPIMIAAHWVPEMVGKAGGQMLLSKTGEKSRERGWEEIVKVDPDILILAPCGFSIERASKEIDAIINRKGFKNLKAYKNKKLFYIDGNAYLTRPGPRVIDGVEILTEILYPTIFLRKYELSDWKQLKL